MGLLLSVVITYAGVNEAIECVRHIVSGIVPDTEPDFQDLVQYYTAQLRNANSANSSKDWTQECGQGYLYLTEDEHENLKSVAVKYYGNDTATSTAILFSTKISSFGQESVEENENHANGHYKTEEYKQPKTKTILTESVEESENHANSYYKTEEYRQPKTKIILTESVEESENHASHYKTEEYKQPKTKTILTNSSESINVGRRSKSPTSYENIPHENTPTPEPIEPEDYSYQNGTQEKLTWHYQPKNPSPDPQALPEIHFQSFDDDKRGVYSEDFLRSLDGIKYRPLQRSDPSGRRRSFKKRHSSSSNSSRESRASREEELKIFTSLEEAEFERMNTDTAGAFGSTPNLSARSHSRSRSRENSREKRTEHWSMDGSVDSTVSDGNGTLNTHIKDLPKLNSFDEETKETNEVIEEEDDVDFWGNSGD